MAIRCRFNSIGAGSASEGQPAQIIVLFVFTHSVKYLDKDSRKRNAQHYDDDDIENTHKIQGRVAFAEKHRRHDGHAENTACTHCQEQNSSVQVERQADAVEHYKPCKGYNYDGHFLQMFVEIFWNNQIYDVRTFDRQNQHDGAWYRSRQHVWQVFSLHARLVGLQG